MHADRMYVTSGRQRQGRGHVDETTRWCDGILFPNTLEVQTVTNPSRSGIVFILGILGEKHAESRTHTHPLPKLCIGTCFLGMTLDCLASHMYKDQST